MKSGGPKITLETDSSDIHVYRTQGGERKESSGAEEAHFRLEIPDIAHRSVIVLPICDRMTEGIGGSP
jgi:hypothetical protein